MKFKHVEIIFLVILFGTFLYLGPANVLDNKISHEFPYGYYASDAFWHQLYTRHLSETGSFRYYGSYFRAGIENTLAVNPPILYHISAAFSGLTGIETYDTIYILTYILSIFGAFAFYFTIRKFSRNIAILSAPLFLLIFTGTFIFALTWGFWHGTLASVYLLAMFWSIANINLKKSFYLLGIFLTGTALTHTPEFIFALGFIIFYFGIKTVFKGLKKSHLKKLGLAAVITFILSIYYLIIFKFVWAVKGSFQFGVQTFDPAKAFYLITFEHFTWIKYLILLGLIISIFMYKKFSVALYSGIFMFIIGYTNYIGFGRRAYGIRYFWPIYLSVFFGVISYFILKWLVKKWNPTYSAVLALVFIIIIGFNFYRPFSGSGLINSQIWDAFEFIRGNTPEDSKVLFMYGDAYDQDAMQPNIRRVPTQIVVSNYFQTAQSGKLGRYFDMKLVYESAGKVATRQGLFKFTDNIPNIIKYFKGDICDYDYFVIDIASRNQGLGQYNLFYKEKLKENGLIKEVFNNNFVVILNNEDHGDCFEEQTVA